MTVRESLDRESNLPRAGIMPNERLRHMEQFDGLNLPGEIHVAVTLRAMPVEACYLGRQQSLENLAKLVEPEIDHSTTAASA